MKRWISPFAIPRSKMNPFDAGTFCRTFVHIIAGLMIFLTGCQSERLHSESETEHNFRQPIISSQISEAEAVTHPFIYVGREVTDKGVIRLEGGMALTDAIASAGGLNQYAGRNHIELLRKGKRAGIYDYDAILKRKATDPILMPGDSIFVTGASF
jgi:hypothetical protein